MNHPQRKFKIVPDDPEVTRADIELARIAQNWREWIGINGHPWTPISEPKQNPTLLVDDVLEKSAWRVVVDSPTPLWRSVFKKLRLMR